MTSTRVSTLIAGLAVAASLSACAGMTPREHSTAVGAGVGAAAGGIGGLIYDLTTRNKK